MMPEDLDYTITFKLADESIKKINELNKEQLEEAKRLIDKALEDYEKPKGNWTIDPMNEDCIDDGKYTAPDDLERYEELGLKFNTEEEAKKAVEKLRAWKRLKDRGFNVDLWDYDGGNYQERIKTGRILFRVKDYEENDKDLDLLFNEKEYLRKEAQRIVEDNSDYYDRFGGEK